ncbi:alpha/beta hydrolase [Deltaproteobacteria bacterium]|nr:alpha/beta hydrolase [Deltaproteobacteria bacterium]
MFKRIARWAGSIMIAAYALGLVVLFLAQRSLLFAAPVPLPTAAPRSAERATLSLSGGTVPMWWSNAADAPMVLFFHGNGGQLSRTVRTGRDAAAAGLGFAAVEYPGYGESTGAGPSEEGCIEAGRAAIAELTKRGFSPPICMGHSLGTGVATALAAEGRCAGLVLASPYTSIADVAAERYPFVPVRWLLLDPFDSLARAPSVEVPALVVHGLDDGVIPFTMGRTLANAIPNARFLERKRHHNDILDGETWAKVAEFAGVEE